MQPKPLLVSEHFITAEGPARQAALQALMVAYLHILAAEVAHESGDLLSFK